MTRVSNWKIMPEIKEGASSVFAKSPSTSGIVAHSTTNCQIMLCIADTEGNGEGKLSLLVFAN